MPNDGLCGLVNMGNSCYLNSCMQILSNTHELSHFLETSDFRKTLERTDESVLVLEWNRLRAELWGNNKLLIPSGFVGAVRKIAASKKKTDFTGNRQNDMQEYLVFILECFHTALTRPREESGFPKLNVVNDIYDDRLRELLDRLYTTDYSIMIELFNGIQISQIADIMHNKPLANIPEQFFTIILPIPDCNNVSVFSCLDLYCKSENLSGDNAWLNEQTNKMQDVNISILFWSLPKILILSLNRFKNNGRKIKSVVDIPVNDVDFSKYVKGTNSASYIYDLYGICNHHGESGGGHYTSYVKNQNGKWYCFNDNNISEIKEDDIITSDAYCIFYTIKK